MWVCMLMLWVGGGERERERERERTKHHFKKFFLVLSRTAVLVTFFTQCCRFGTFFLEYSYLSSHIVWYSI